MLIDLAKFNYPLKFYHPFRFNIYDSLINTDNIHALYNAVPNEEIDLTIRNTGSDKSYKLHNRVLFDEANNIDFNALNLPPIWITLLSNLTSAAYIKNVAASLHEDILQSHVQIMLKQYEDGGYISMHTDDEAVYATHLFYINPHFDPSFGGDLLFHSNNYEIAAQFPAIPSLSILFERSDCSWHSVEPCYSTRFPKITLQIAFWKKLKKRGYVGRQYSK